MVQRFADMVHYELDCDLVLDTSRYDNVGHVLLWFHVSGVVGFDEGEPLLDATLDVAASFSDVSHN